MPALPKIVFANHKGGVGKTVLLFHTACAIAALHPNLTVLVLDFTELGDVSKLLLGGVGTENLFAAGKGDTAVNKLCQRARCMSALVEAATKISQSEAQQEVQDVIDMFERLSMAHRDNLDLSSYVTRVHAKNFFVPRNVYVVPSAGTRQTYDPGDTLRKVVVGVLNQALEAFAGNTVVLMDTDGDRRFSTYTKVAFGMAQHAVIPLETDPTDFKRLRSMLTELRQMRIRGESYVTLKQVVWNKITNIQSDKEGSSVSVLYTPTKVHQSLIHGLNAVLCRMLRMTRELCAIDLDTTLADVEQNLTTCVRAFGATGHICAFFGIPFCTTKPVSDFPEATIEGISLGKSTVGQEQLRKLKENIDLLAKQILRIPPPGAAVARNLRDFDHVESVI